MVYFWIKVGTLFTLTEGVDEDWHRHNIGGQNSLTLFEPGRSAVEFQLPVNSFKIFGKEIWAVDIHGRLGLICPNAELCKVNSKLSKTLTCRHIERRTFKYPIQKVVMLDNIAVILSCNNQCEFFLADPDMKDNVKQVGVMVGVGLNYIQNNNWLYSIIDVINIVSGTVDRIFNGSTHGLHWQAFPHIF